MSSPCESTVSSWLIERFGRRRLQRLGFFICDQEYAPAGPNNCCEAPVVLFAIPDGHTKETAPVAAAASKKEAAASKKEAAASKKAPAAAAPVSDQSSTKKRSHL